MISSLSQLDTHLFLWLNGLHTPALDLLMYQLTRGLIWLPLFLLFLYTLIRAYKKKSWIIILALISVIALTDQTSVHLFKNTVKRLRPSHNPELAEKVHIVKEYRGGLYGFVSSHAANTFAVALLLSLFIRRRWFTWTALGWAAVMSYTRIYLGVHYPGDIVCGALWGMLMSVFIYLLFRKLFSARLNEYK